MVPLKTPGVISLVPLPGSTLKQWSADGMFGASVPPQPLGLRPESNFSFTIVGTKVFQVVRLFIGGVEVPFESNVQSTQYLKLEYASIKIASVLSSK